MVQINAPVDQTADRTARINVLHSIRVKVSPDPTASANSVAPDVLLPLMANADSVAATNAGVLRSFTTPHPRPWIQFNCSKLLTKTATAS
jgi:hypothetical protein